MKAEEAFEKWWEEKDPHVCVKDMVRAAFLDGLNAGLDEAAEVVRAINLVVDNNVDDDGTILAYGESIANDILKLKGE